MNCMSACAFDVFTCIRMRRHIGRLPGTAISCAHISATCVQPIWRAATAGNSAFRSGVVEKNTLATSSISTSFASTIAERSSFDAARIASLVLASTVVAPRIPRSRIASFVLMDAPPSTVAPPGPTTRTPGSRLASKDAGRGSAINAAIRDRNATFDGLTPCPPCGR